MPETENKGTIRRLSAILFCDIAGYTKLMQEDEQRGMSLLSRYQKVLDDCVSGHQGEVVKNYGDGSLSLFDNALSCLIAAKEIQTRLVSQAVPLRIGLHLGDVTLQGGDVYGDSINIAARIESISDPGSVLMSSSFFDKVRNQADYSFLSYGPIRFKNVSKPIEILALAEQGLSIPAKTIIQKRSYGKSSFPWKWVYALIGLILVTILILNRFVFNSNQSSISATNKSKVVAISEFSNETSNPDLDAFGLLISDWIAKDLLIQEDIHLVNGDYVKQSLAQWMNSNPSSAKSSIEETLGVGLFIQGRFYEIENDFYIQVEIMDLATREIIHKIPLVGSKDDKIALLEELRNKVLDYWLVRDFRRYVSRPPDYLAYQEYLEGDRLYTSDQFLASEHFERAFEIDSTFYAPLFRLINAYSNQQEYEKRDELVAFLDSRQSKFTKWENLRFKVMKAQLSQDYLQIGRLSEDLVKLDPSDYEASYNAAFAYNNANYPGRALQTLNEFNPKYLQEDGRIIGWRSAQKAFAHHRLGDFQSILKLADEYRFPKMFTPLAVFNLKALVRLDSLNRLTKTLAQYQGEGVFITADRRDESGHLLLIVCNEFLLADKREQMAPYIALLEQFIASHEFQTVHDSIPDFYNNYPPRKEELLGYIHFYRGHFDKALEAWNQEQIHQNNWPDRMEQASRIGFCYAKIGDTTRAEEQLQTMNALTSDHPSWTINHTYYRARILTGLNEKEKATQSVAKALEDGLLFFRPAVLDGDPFLLGLLGYTPFESLLKPKE